MTGSPYFKPDVCEEAIRKLYTECHPLREATRNHNDCVRSGICPACGEWMERDREGFWVCERDGQQLCILPASLDDPRF